MTTVEIKNLTKQYKETEVLHGINVSIEQGEFVVIVGPSGCGKSSLLRMIAGLEEVTAGEIIINGNVVNQLPPKDRDIAMVFQNYALYPHMNIYDNMAYGLKMRGFKRDEIRHRVEQAAEKLQLTGLLKRKPHVLSGGQRQRVAMGRAIVREPALFLFDEPLSNLDAKLRVDMRLEIHKMQRSLGITSIYVTHDQVEAMTLADKLIILNNGRVEQVGKPLQIYENPATRFVAEFIGSPSMNLLSAEVTNNGDQVVFPDGQTLPVAKGRILPESLTSHSVLVGLRPEAVKIAEAHDSSQFRIKVEMVEALGCDTIVYGRTISGSKLVVKLPGHVKTHDAEVMTLAVRPGNIHLFDKETGKRIG